VQRISLPDGWTIDQAIPLANLEFIMGKKGYTFRTEPGSNPEEDHPIGSFVLPHIPTSRIRFEVLADGRRADFDRIAGELRDSIDFPGRRWETAALGEVSQEGRTQVRLVGLRGDVCFVITWDPAAYPDLDRTMVCLKLAELRLNGMYSRHFRALDRAPCGVRGGWDEPPPPRRGITLASSRI